MGHTTICKRIQWEDTGCKCMARIIGSTGGTLAKADLTAISRHIFDLDSTAPNTPASTWSTTSPSTMNVFGTLKTGGWNQDGTGYNFSQTLLHTHFPKGDRRYQVEYSFTPSSTAEPRFKVVYQVTTKRILGS